MVCHSKKDYKIEVVNKKELLKAVLNDEVVVDINSLVNVKIGVLKTYLKNSGKDKIAGCVVKRAVIQKFQTGGINIKMVIYIVQDSGF
jgi:hypothetical protein